MKCHLTKLAENDIAAILRTTRIKFGPGQVYIYAKIIDRGLAMVAHGSSRPSVIERNDIAEGVKSFHLELAAKRRHGASHVLYFMQAPDKDGNLQTIILRVLHESMEAKRRLIQALRERETSQ